MNKKSSSGRQRIPIEKIPKKSNLQVTFSKRRSGLFKKASELCTLCGVEIAIIVFSPANKAFSFGHPGVEYIIDRYLTERNSSHIDLSVSVRRNSNVRTLNMQLTQLLNQLEMEKKRGEELDQARKREFWRESRIDELGSLELQQLMISMEELKKDVLKHTSKLLMDQTSFSSCSPIVGANYGFGCYDDAFENTLASAEINAASSSTLPNDAFNLIYPTRDMDIFNFKFTSQC